MIPREFIDEVLGRVDIVEVIEKRVPLRKAGNNYKACCPFHHEKTPPFSVSSTKQFYYCFGCHASGNAIGFLMQYDRMGFVDAVETLASMVNMPLPQTTQPQSPQLEPLYQILAKVNQSYQDNLNNTPKAQAYLQSRGLSVEIIQRFQLGYALDRWDQLAQQFVRSGVQRAQLIRAGMLTEKSPDTCYDRFRGRIMFPIKDLRGRVIAFGGRVIGQGEPKYLNSPETPLFHKSRELYGVYEARSRCRTLSKVVVVEGYMDVIALANHGIEYAVATLGTASNVQHIQKLLRLTQTIVFCFDGDRAGRKAAIAAMENALPIMRDGISINFMFLPQGFDPDGYVNQNGAEAFTTLAEKAVSLADFFFAYLKKQPGFNTTAGKARLGARAGQQLAQLPNGIFKSLLLKRLAQTLGIEATALSALIRPASQNRHSNPSSQTQVPVLSAPIRTLLSVGLQNPKLLVDAIDAGLLDQLNLPETMPGARLFDQLIAAVRTQPQINTGQLLEIWRDSQFAELMASLAASEQLLAAPQLGQELHGALIALKQLSRDHLIDQYFAKAAHADLTTDEKQHLQQLLADKAQ